jgi:hypothetical protein
MIVQGFELRTTLVMKGTVDQRDEPPGRGAERTVEIIIAERIDQVHQNAVSKKVREVIEDE